MNPLPCKFTCLELTGVMGATGVTGAMVVTERTELMGVRLFLDAAGSPKMAGMGATGMTGVGEVLPEMAVEGAILSTLVINLLAISSWELRTSTTKAVLPESLEMEGLAEWKAGGAMAGVVICTASGLFMRVATGKEVLEDSKVMPVSAGPRGWSELSDFLLTI